MKRGTKASPPTEHAAPKGRGIGQEDGIGPGRALAEDDGGPDPYRRAMRDGQGPEIRQKGGYGGQYAGLPAGSPGTGDRPARRKRRG
ncbi:MAG: hypothetical protein ACOY4R_21755 [Pseudomonadota bacterium]